MQLKVADKSLRKKRKDPLGTGLYLNPGKYVSYTIIKIFTIVKSSNIFLFFHQNVYRLEGQ